MRVNLKEEMICGYKVTEEMKRVWMVELDLLEKLIDVCERNGLKYFATYGTLLGAVRHKGFIPWDDDIDITMPREDFEKLKAIAADEFKHPYFFQTPENDPQNFTAGGCRLRNSDTTYLEFINLGHSCNNGCYIDITSLDGVFDDEKKRKRQIKRIEFYKSMLYAKVYGNDFYQLFDYTTLKWAAYRFLARFISHRRLCKKFDAACSVCPLENTNYAGVFTQKNGEYEFRYFKKEIFEKTVLLEFEHLKIPAPCEYDLFLSSVWGNYMELPLVNERKPRHAAIIDTQTIYKDFASAMFTDVFKNIKDKDILLFGAGKMFDYYMKKHGRKYRPKFVFDNDKNKWGTVRNGIPVKNPIELLDFKQENIRVIITNIYFEEVIEQLKELGIKEFYVYLQGRKY